MTTLFQLEKTCSGCPEQYNVFMGGKYVGYARLRHGYFRMENANDVVVYDANPPGPGGIFDSAEDREKYLSEGLAKLLENMGKEAPIKLYEIEDKTWTG